ncbi:MAG: hypothetical protein EXS35_12830 [Pedosphaera sp.]|nr:hypothetical protein [Pedosphaera sp.]
MISLAHDCMLFELTSGESIPFSAEMISVELMGDAADKFDPEVIHHAAASVFHYFRKDLARDTVTVAEFAEALEKVLRELGFKVRAPDPPPGENPTADLNALARDSGAARELVFFPRLRRELRTQLQASPRLIRFRGLRGCVKQLAGARRWSPRCENLRDQIVGYLRECLTTEPREAECVLVVE